MDELKKAKVWTLEPECDVQCRYCKKTLHFITEGGWYCLMIPD